MLYDWWVRYRLLILLAGIGLFVAVSLLLYHSEEVNVDLPLETPAYAMEKENGEKPAEEQDPSPVVEKKPEIYVDVKGSVKQPGLYRFSSGERVFDAIAKAGGSLPEADLNRINLAEPLSDGSVVRIPKRGESLAEGACPCGNTAVSSSPPSTGRLTTQQGVVNINTASLQELMTLPGVGETRARSILDYRSKNGPFRTTEDVLKVTGIGDKMYERMKDHITVR
jgi:competence protein ComEA